MFKALLPLAALAALAVPATAQDSGLDGRAALVGKFSAEYAQYWKDQESQGKPTLHLPTQFEIPPQYATSVTKEERQLMGRRLRAMIDFVLAQPALQDSDIEVSVRPSLYRLRMPATYLTMTLSFTVQKGSEKGTFDIWTTPYESSGEVWRNVGQSTGACQREQLTNGLKRGTERLRVGKGGPNKGTAIGTVDIMVPTLRFDREGAPMRSEEAMDGRLAALGHGLDCNRLLALANTP